MKRVAVMLTLAALVALCAAPASAVVINAAAYGTATQSSYRAGSTTQGDHAQYAVDGITNGNFNSGSVTHTNGQTDPWWEVDLKAVRTIEDIVVWNRTDCCMERIDGFKLSVLDASRAEVWSANPPRPSPSESVNVGGVDGRYVRIDLTGGGRVLSLAEVQVMADVPGNDPLVFAPGRNLARAAVATQSSTRQGDPKGNQPILAIDGNTNGVFGNRSVTHSLNELTPSWQVDLTAAAAIDHIRLYERTDSCCNGRLSDFSVSVLDESMTELFRQEVASVGTYLDVPVPYGTNARYVKVQLNDNGASRTLELAEVEVIGSDAGVTNVARNPNAVATQSSTRTGSGANVASAAIDGNTDGRWNSSSTTHTLDIRDPNDPRYPSWWQVDLGGDFSLEQIDLFNRADCCGNRLSDFHLSVLDDGVEVWGQDYFTDGTSVPQGGIFSVDMGGLEGDTVRVALLGLNDRNDGVLSLAEVQVWATPEPATLSLLGLGGLALLRRRRRAS